MNRYLTIYLNDHRAIEDALVMSIQRVLRSNSNTPWADELRSLNEAITADAAELDAIRQAADVDGGHQADARTDEPQHVPTTHPGIFGG